MSKRLITLDGEVSAVGANSLLVGVKSNKEISSVLRGAFNKGVSLSEDSVTRMYESVPLIGNNLSLANQLK